MNLRASFYTSFIQRSPSKSILNNLLELIGIRFVDWNTCVYFMRQSVSINWELRIYCCCLLMYFPKGIKLKIFGEVSSTVLFFGSFACFHLDFGANDDTGSTNKIFAKVIR
ncbi:hypothetical protein RND81_11G040100 [Saponaria officinalis]|uniref:Uncharacterized protein n=1 Tax=Saponaria officinalis TaxID=3572 RepID=A0AAW1HI37_SAPOF